MFVPYVISHSYCFLLSSGPGDKSTHLYTDAKTFVLTLKRPSKTQQEKTEEEKELPSDGDYEIEEKQKAVSLSESGIKKAELYFFSFFLLCFTWSF